MKTIEYYEVAIFELYSVFRVPCVCSVYILNLALYTYIIYTNIINEKIHLYKEVQK